MPTDAELLSRYLDQGDERAFEEVVRRHLGVVYAAALRRTSGRTHLAEEVSQKVFSTLAREARRLVKHPALIGWLYRCTHNAAMDVLRAESRREKFVRTLSAMPDETVSSSLPDVDWERLRPFLDRAMDRLKEQDRDILLLRFFSGLTFAAIGERLGVEENTARMRATRALEKLHAQLSRQGFTSTTAALSGLLATTAAMASAPAGLASTISASAVAGVAAGASTGILSLFFMSKIMAPVLSAGVAAALVGTAWYHTARGNLEKGLAPLREEHARLTQGGKADAFSQQATAVSALVSAQHGVRLAAASAHNGAVSAGGSGASAAEAQPGSSRVPDSPRGHRWEGQATAENAGRSFAWACDMADAAALSKLIWFEPELRERAREMLATMPPAIQAEYPTPEQFYALVLAADALLYPPPLPEMISREKFTEVTLREGRVAFRAVGSERNQHEYQQTPEGWKFVMPAVGVERWPANLNNELLAKMSGGHPP